MPLSKKRTLTQYLIEQRRRFPQARGHLNALILDVSIACKAIARQVALAALAEVRHLELGGELNVQGEEQKPLDIISNLMLIRQTDWSGHLAGMASEELEAQYKIPKPHTRGNYLLVFDPLDGSSNRRFWEPPVTRYVDGCLAGRSGPRGKDFKMRWIASMVAGAHRILMRGRVFLYPRDSKDRSRPGRLRLLYEANPVGRLMVQAGGCASTGRAPVLGVHPEALHQRIGLVFSSRNEVERIERYHLEPQAHRDSNPLFAERSLFRL